MKLGSNEIPFAYLNCYDIFVTINKENGSRYFEIVKALEIPPVPLARALKKLAGSGFIHRQELEGKGRLVRYSRTEKGNNVEELWTKMLTSMN